MNETTTRKKTRTPGYTIRLEIRFGADKNGKPLAHYWSPRGRRFFRIGYDEAKLLIATNAADEMPRR